MASVAAPHREAEAAGACVLAEGGNAIEAAIAVAAALCAVYPHMTGLGGDGFWIVAEPGKVPVGLRACGPAARAASPEWYRSRGFSSVPTRGAAAALTVAGAISGWDLALDLSRAWGGRLPVARLLADAKRLAVQGVSVSRSQAALTRAKADELTILSGFKEIFAPEGPPAEGDILVQARLASAFDELSRKGFDDFYRGELGRAVAADLAGLGSPIVFEDLAAFRAVFVDPLSVELSIGTVWNLPPPTQGAASLAILALFDRLGVASSDGFAHVHALVEATKLAFGWRNAHVGDPARMETPLRDLLAPDRLDALAREVDSARARPWPSRSDSGDTVWFGVVDDQGRMVSALQSLYWEFGSGVVLPETGFLWQNRGASFTLEAGPNRLEPGRLPFHTLNPALARLKDGRTVAYGTMGGDGQPQTQAAFLTRYAWFGRDLKESIEAPRWLLGRTWGEETTSLRLENRFDASVVEALAAAGHAVETVDAYDDRMGHAGAVVLHPEKTEAAHDPRSDGGGLDVDAAEGIWRLEGFLADLAAFGAETDGGVTRLLYDEAWQKARNWMAAKWSGLGLRVRDDRVGNLYGRLEGTGSDGKVILTGSHFDTVRHGGWYDGAYGVAASSLALAELSRRHGPPRRTVEVVAFCEEEGSRFPLAYWGSGHLAGRWPVGYGDTQKDPEGVSLTEAMKLAGFGNPEQPDPARNDLAAFIELHVEQGIVLERSNERIGVVSAIAGQRRWRVRLTGQANHAGTTPMSLRRDAFAGAAEMANLVETEARLRGDPLVATVGYLEIHPNTPNVVPGSVSFSVDIRHTSEDELDSFCRSLETVFQEIASRRSLGFDLERRLAVAPSPMDADLRSLIQRSCEARRLSFRTLPSGAGHDAQVLSGICPSAMIFVPSRKGISHSPLEYSSHQALSDGLSVLSEVLYELAWKGTRP